MALLEDEQLAEARRRRGGGRGPIQTTPTGPRPGGGRGSGGGGGQSGQTPPPSQELGAGADGTTTNAAGDSESGIDYRRKAGQRYIDQAANLEAQARALRYALKNSYKDSLQIKLQNVNEILKQQDRALVQGYRARVGSLEGALEDNNNAANTQSLMNAQNQRRERLSALSELAAQGAGESDSLVAQAMSLRNWQANQSEIDRSEFDTLRSINSSLTDLNVDTKTGRINLQSQALADKELLWTNYYNQRSESQTQLGNIRGQQADYLDYAQEYGVGKGGNTASAEKAFMDAAKTAGQAWDSPGISKRLRKWDGRDLFEIERPPMSTRLQAAPTVDLGARPEGATLRTW